MPKCCACHKYQRGFFCPICPIQIATVIFCIFCPDVSQCPERTKKVVLAETDNVLRFSPGKIFLFQHSTTSSLQDEVVECWNKKIFPGFFKKNSHATWQASNSRSPLQPPLQSCNWKRVNVPNMNGCFFWRPMGTTRKKQLWSWGARGDPTLESTILSDGCFLWRTRYGL